jgi:hypothetical protein
MLGLMGTMFLTTSERAVFDALPRALREGWVERTKEEGGTAYESEKQRETRLRIVAEEYKRYPHLQRIAEGALKQVAEGKGPEDLSLEEIPQDALMPLLFSLGASGVSALIEALLGDVKSDEDLSGIAALSEVRHAILESNATLSF